MYRLRLLIIWLLILVMMVMIPSAAKMTYKEEYIGEEDIYMLMDNWGDGLAQIRINGWALVNRRTMDIKELEKMASQATLYLSGSLEYNTDSKKRVQTRQAITEFNIEGIEGRIIYNNSTDYLNNNLHETYAVIDILLLDDYGDNNITSTLLQRAEEIKKRIHDYFNIGGKEIHITSTYMATSTGRLSEDEIEVISSDIFKKLGGHVMEGLKDIRFISLTGYSPRIREGLETQNGTININVAARYNAYDNKSYLWLGIPIINAEY